MIAHRFDGFVALLGAFGLLGACASGNAARTDVGAGGVGLGGSASASLGGSASASLGGNAGVSSNGTGGTGGSTGGRDCPASETLPAPADGVIATFTEPDGGVQLGALGAFPLESPSAPTFATADGTLRITTNTPATSEPQYALVLLGFPGCIDAREFEGVEFSIQGSVSGCTLQYATADVAHQDRTSGAPYATGLPGSYQPQTTITGAQLAAPGVTLTVPFVGGATGGNPSTPVDPAKLIFLFWQFSIPAASAGGTPCVADISVDDVRFY